MINTCYEGWKEARTNIFFSVLCTSVIIFAMFAMTNQGNKCSRSESITDQLRTRGSMPANELFRESRYLCLNKSYIAVLGDSQMMQTTISLVNILEKCTLMKKGQRCGEDTDYFGLERPLLENIVYPKESEGPVGHGLGNIGSGCRDCSGCHSSLYICKDECLQGEQAVLNEMTLEYIAVEFARDVSIQSLRFLTTQENIVDYLRNRNVSHVVFNTGLHDTALRDSSPAAYDRNLYWYFSLLKKRIPSANLLWIDTTFVVGNQLAREYQNITTNDKIFMYNKIATRLTNLFGIPRLSPFNVLQLPYFQRMNLDGIHYSGIYYEMLSYSILSTFCSKI